MALLIALLDDPCARSRLDRAVQVERASRAAHELHYVRSWPDLHELAYGSAPQLAIIDPYSRGELDHEACAAFRLKFGSVALLPYGDFSARPARDVLRLVELGITEVVSRGIDDEATVLRLIITDALAGSATGQLLACLEDRIPEQLQGIFRHLLSTRESALRPAEVASSYGRSEKTLRQHLRAAGLPPINKLLVWTRLFRAAALLPDEGRTIENVALLLGWDSAAAFRKQLARYTGLSPSDLREVGAAALLVEEFRTRYGRGSW